MESQQSSQLADAQENSGSIRHFDQRDGQCIVCRRALPLENEANEGFEAICICRECKSLIVDGLETNITRRDSHRSHQQRGRSRRGSSESIEDLFSQQFSQLISLVRQNHEALVDNYNLRHARYNSHGSRSRRSRWTLSDNDSDGFDHIDSLFGESDSNISFGGYGGESDASADQRSVLDREMFIQLDNESLNLSDTDIDPMNAGLHQWNSNQDEEDREWEEEDFEEEVFEPDGHRRYASNSPFGSSRRGIENGTVVRWTVRANGLLHYPDNFSDLEDSEIPPYVGNLGDYLDARGLEELLEQLAETDGSRRGAPPAASSLVGSLPRVVISKDHENNGSLTCAVCKDPIQVNTEANQLPCLHLYHPSCILPWLTARNSCPLCRYELPTDDHDYEEGKRNLSRAQFNETQLYDVVDGSSSNASSDLEVDVASELIRERAQEGMANHPREDNASIEGSSRGWLFLAAAAAPIVSIFGIVLVMWFRNTERRGRNAQQLPRSARINVEQDGQCGKSRRWWSFF